MPKVKAVVHKERTLGLLHHDGRMQILHAKIMKDHRPEKLSGLMDVMDSDLRPATLRDFGDFGVQWFPDYEITE